MGLPGRPGTFGGLSSICAYPLEFPPFGGLCHTSAGATVCPMGLADDLLQQARREVEAESGPLLIAIPELAAPPVLAPVVVEPVAEPEVDFSDAESWSIQNVEVSRERRAKREEQESRRGFNSRANCSSCGRFKSKPADVCGHCGLDPVQHAGDRYEYNRCHGAAY